MGMVNGYMRVFTQNHSDETVYDLKILSGRCIVQISNALKSGEWIVSNLKLTKLLNKFGVYYNGVESAQRYQFQTTPTFTSKQSSLSITPSLSTSPSSLSSVAFIDIDAEKKKKKNLGGKKKKKKKKKK